MSVTSWQSCGFLLLLTLYRWKADGTPLRCISKLGDSATVWANDPGEGWPECAAGWHRDMPQKKIWSFSRHGAPVRQQLWVSVKIIIYNSGCFWAKSYKTFSFIFFFLKHYPDYPGRCWDRKVGKTREQENHAFGLSFLSPKKPKKG